MYWVSTREGVGRISGRQLIQERKPGTGLNVCSRSEGAEWENSRCHATRHTEIHVGAARPARRREARELELGGVLVGHLVVGGHALR